ncbi:MAG: hypothetical protein EBS01_03675 [Verrucomicrobia bacterium]|nr:hypothetical protein [Verrucomicrobiota bacterium]
MRWFSALTLLVCGAAACGAEPKIADLLKKGDALEAQLKTAEALDVFLEAEKADPKNAEILRRIAKQRRLQRKGRGIFPQSH